MAQSKRVGPKIISPSSETEISSLPKFLDETIMIWAFQYFLPVLLARSCVVSSSMDFGRSLETASLDCIDSNGRLLEGWSIQTYQCKEGPSVFFYAVENSPISANGLQSGAPTDLHLKFGSLGNPTSVAFDPHNIGLTFPPGGKLVVELSDHFIFQNELATAGTFVDLAVALGNPILPAPCDSSLVACGDWFSQMDGTNKIEFISNNPEGLQGARAKQIGVKIAHIHPRLGTSNALFRNALGVCSEDESVLCIEDSQCGGTCTPKTMQAYVVATVYDSGNNIVHLAEQSVRLHHTPSLFTVHNTNWGLTNNKEVIQSVDGQRVSPGALLDKYNLPSTGFASGGPFAPRFLIFGPKNNLSGFPHPAPDISGFRLSSDKNEIYIRSVDSDGVHSTIGTGRIKSPYPFLESGSFVPIGNETLLIEPLPMGGFLLPLPVLLDNIEGIHEVVLTMVGGSQASTRLIAESSPLTVSPSLSPIPSDATNPPSEVPSPKVTSAPVPTSNSTPGPTAETSFNSAPTETPSVFVGGTRDPTTELPTSKTSTASPSPADLVPTETPSFLDGGTRDPTSTELPTTMTSTVTPSPAGLGPTETPSILDRGTRDPTITELPTTMTSTVTPSPAGLGPTETPSILDRGTRDPTITELPTTMTSTETPSFLDGGTRDPTSTELPTTMTSTVTPSPAGLGPTETPSILDRGTRDPTITELPTAMTSTETPSFLDGGTRDPTSTELPTTITSTDASSPSGLVPTATPSFLDPTSTTELPTTNISTVTSSPSGLTPTETPSVLAETETSTPATISTLEPSNTADLVPTEFPSVTELMGSAIPTLILGASSSVLPTDEKVETLSPVHDIFSSSNPTKTPSLGVNDPTQALPTSSPIQGSMAPSMKRLPDESSAPSTRLADSESNSPSTRSSTGPSEARSEAPTLLLSNSPSYTVAPSFNPSASPTTAEDTENDISSAPTVSNSGPSSASPSMPPSSGGTPPSETMSAPPTSRSDGGNSLIRVPTQRPRPFNAGIVVGIIAVTLTLLTLVIALTDEVAKLLFRGQRREEDCLLA